MMSFESFKEKIKISYNRRRYGSRNNPQFFCWAYVTYKGEIYSLGDPYPAVNWKKAALDETLFNLYRQVTGQLKEIYFQVV